MLRLWLRGISQASRPAAARWLHVLAAGGLPGDSSSGSTPSALQHRLADMGVPDWRAYGKLHHAALVGEAAEQFAAKVAELTREGVTAEDVERLFAQPASPRACSLEDTFLPNLAYLRGLLTGANNEPRRGKPAGLTPLGRLLRRQPSALALILSLKPELILELERWVCGELGVAQAELAEAALKYPAILYLSVDAGRSAAAFFEEELGLPRGEVVRLLLQQPNVFRLKPEVLREKIGKLGDILGVGQLRAFRMMVSHPMLFGYSLTELRDVMVELDTLFGREGAGAALVMKDPKVATLSVSRLRRSLGGLSTLGVGEREVVVALVEFDPSVLIQDLGGEVQQQKMAWPATELKWPVQKMLANSLFTRDRMASRLAFRRHLGLPDPGSLRYIGSAAEPKFLGQLSKRVGREVGKAEFDAFVAEWLRTEQGRQYGFKPDTVPRNRKPSSRA